MNQLVRYDAIGNQIADEPVSVGRISRQGYLYRANGLMFMFMSGAFTDAEVALSVHSWDAEGFIDIAGALVDQSNSMNYMVDLSSSPHSIVPREPLPAVLDGYILKGVPDGGMVTIEGIQYPTDGSDIELEFGKAGTYVVKCEGFPYTPVDIEVVYETQA